MRASCRTIRRSPQFGCDEFSHLVLVQAASHKIQDVGVISLLVVAETGSVSTG